MIRIRISDPRDHPDHGRSNEPMNPHPEWIHRFILSTMIRATSDHWFWSASSQRNAPFHWQSDEFIRSWKIGKLQKNCQRALPLVLVDLWWLDQKKRTTWETILLFVWSILVKFSIYCGPEQHANLNNGDRTRRSCGLSYIFGDFSRDWPCFSMSSAANYEAECSNSWTSKSAVLSRKDARFTSLKGNSKQKFYKETYGDSAILYRPVKGCSHSFIVLTLCILSSQNKLCGIGSVLYLFWKMLRFVVIMRW